MEIELDYEDGRISSSNIDNIKVTSSISLLLIGKNTDIHDKRNGYLLATTKVDRLFRCAIEKWKNHFLGVHMQ